MKLPFEVWATTDSYGKTCVAKFITEGYAEDFILRMPKPDICEILNRDEINEKARKLIRQPEKFPAAILF